MRQAVQLVNQGIIPVQCSQSIHLPCVFVVVMLFLLFFALYQFLCSVCVWGGEGGGG